MERLLAGGDRNRLKAQSRTACEARYRRFAMLTPCMVSTFYRAPGVFDCFDAGRSQPLFGAVDLLIVDEAGQTSPEVGAAVFALARRALVVGDVHQIEPIWNLTPGIDRGNLRAEELPDHPPDTEAERAHRVSTGSLMLLARRATAASAPDDRGLFLAEHRRCLPEIIQYCNQLVYGGRLHSLRPTPEEPVPLPPMGWAHVASPARRAGGSRTNPGEARAIAHWLAGRRDELEAAYARPLKAAIEAARRRGVLVEIYYARDLADGRAGTDGAVGRLRAAGAEVRRVERIHNKTLAVDSHWIVEGSFNWLSAVRDQSHPWQRHEASLLCQGDQAARFIRTAWDEMLART